MTPEEAATRTELRALSERYAAACDSRDHEAFGAVFTADARFRIFEPSDAPEPRREIVGREKLARIPGSVSPYDQTYHFVGNATYALGEDEATGEVYCQAHHLNHISSGASANGGLNYVMYIRYRDVYRREEPGGPWLIADRRIHIDWTELHPTQPRR